MIDKSRKKGMVALQNPQLRSEMTESNREIMK